MDINFTVIETIWGNRDIAIQIERSEEFTIAARKLSEFIRGLPLTSEQNNRLVDGMVEQVLLAERGAFKRGFGLGVEYGRYETVEGGADG